MKSPLAALLWRSLRVYQVFGANTDVGKTIFTTLLARTARKKAQDEHVAFLKPVSTGAADEADDRYWSNVDRRQPIPSDDALLTECRAFAAQCAASATASSNSGWLFIETAGGVHSPGPSRRTQADLYIPLRAPVLLIGDSRLGGISQTIAAYESLRIRGYEVEAVLLFRNARYENHQFLADYFMQNHRVPVSSVAEPPRKYEQDAREDEVAMRAYYDGADCKDEAGRLLETLRRNHEERLSNLDSMASRASQCIWYPFTQQSLVGPQDIMTIDSAHGDYFQTLAPSPPLPNMTNTSPNTDITSITSITTGNESYIPEKTSPALRASFDASASWWTQGLGHSNPKLTLAAAHAAGRYGHVMFASAIHQPAITLAETLLKSMQNPRLRRVFYSDNGSTGTEVAVKMGLRAARTRYGWGPRENLHILGLKGAYHGDTMGAMDCADPGIYNEKIEWYEGKGYWLDYPTVLCKSGRWTVSSVAIQEKNKGISSAEDGWPVRAYDSLHEIFDIEAREAAGEHAMYEKYITSTLQRLQAQGRKFGALMIEPIILGAGGMQFVDPLFQRTLVNTVRKSPHLFGRSTQTVDIPENGSNNDWTGLPIIFDEVFTGLYRLGRLTPSSFLGVHPDISVHAKLLTGGLVPLCATLASESIFNTFLSPDKTDALLHGHSYTAHPIGCQVALESLREMQAMDRSGVWDWAREQGQVRQQQQQKKKSKHTELGTVEVWSTWPRGFVEDLSHLTDKVEGVWALGSVLAIHMRDAAGSGYSSNAAVGLRESLAVGRPDGEAGPWNVHSRVLGNVLYVMASQVTSQDSVRQLCELLVESLGRGVTR
ncbi:hypothetical protein E4U17_003352 [Claviceps sp. LM77 group G4]|nr:hypothetical protein E4U17_003352 [Claviceps sp. LM77 group G4]